MTRFIAIKLLDELFVLKKNAKYQCKQIWTIGLNLSVNNKPSFCLDSFDLYIYTHMHIHTSIHYYHCMVVAPAIRVYQNHGFRSRSLSIPYLILRFTSDEGPVLSLICPFESNRIFITSFIIDPSIYLAALGFWLDPRRF